MKFFTFWRPSKCSWMMFLERESREREREKVQPKVNGRGGPLLYIGSGVRLEGVCGWVCGWLAVHSSVRPHTPLLVCLA